MGFILGLIIGVVGVGVAFIIFGKNNKRKIEAARVVLLEEADKIEGKAKEFWAKIEKALSDQK